MDADEAFGHWLAGFSDGEGCFTVTKRSDSAGVVVAFQIKLRDDDADILYECQRRLGGTVIRIKESNPKWGDQVVWRVRDMTSLQNLVNLFEAHPLRAKKRKDFEIWKQAVRLRAQVVKHQGNATTKAANAAIWPQMLALKEQLERERTYVRSN